MTSLPQRRAAQVIGSTVSQWLMEILIHWPRLLLFSLCTIFHFLISTCRFIPCVSPQTLICDIPFPMKKKPHHFLHFFKKHTNYYGSNFDCCCHGNCLWGIMVPLKLKWLRVRESERKLGGEDCEGDTQRSLCASIFHVSSCFMACTIGSLPWLKTIWPWCCLASMPENEFDVGEWG